MILQTHLTGAPEAHCEWLLENLDPPIGAKILDAGCGVGEVSTWMAEFRPDLSFILLNNDDSQLRKCPSGPRFDRWLDDYTDTVLKDHSVDCAMYCWSLGYADLGAILDEAYRVVKPGGKVLIYEPEGTEESKQHFLEVCNYRVYSAEELRAEAVDAGFELLTVEYPETTTELAEKWLDGYGAIELFDRVFRPVRAQLLILKKVGS